MNRTSTILMFCLALVAGLLVALPAVAAPDAPLTAIALTGGAYSQDFDTLASSGTSSTVPDGWALSEAGTNGNTTYTASTGSSTTGDTYSYGAAGSAERAFGGLRTGTVVPTIGAGFQNDTGAVITSLMVGYACEQWRVGVTNRGAADRMDFQYSLDAGSLTTGTWIDVDVLGCLSTNISDSAGATNGNSSAYRTTVNGVIDGLDIANGAMIWLRWTDFDITSSDDGLAIDDFILEMQGSTTVTLTGLQAGNPVSASPGWLFALAAALLTMFGATVLVRRVSTR